MIKGIVPDGQTNIDRIVGTVYRQRVLPVAAIQFNYIDNIDGPQTCELAKSLGLTNLLTLKAASTTVIYSRLGNKT